MTTIDTIQECPIFLQSDDTGAEVVVFIADADIDCDGTGGNPHHDPYFQPDTRLHNHGKALCAETERYVVVPPVIIAKTKGIVMGCKAICYNQKTGLKADGVVGDSGPRSKIGEVSVAMAEAIGLSGDPNHGGTDEHVIQYTLYPGVAADGYSLQPS